MQKSAENYFKINLLIQLTFVYLLCQSRQIKKRIKMESISTLRKEAAKAPKFYLTAWHEVLQRYIFVADPHLCADALCVNPEKAQLFSYGFDDETLKEKAWTSATKFEFIAIAA